MDSWLPIFLQWAVIHYFHSLFFCSYRPRLGSWEPRPGLLGPPTARPLSLSTSSRRARLALSSAAGLQVGLPSLGSRMLTTHQGPGGLRVGPSQAEVMPHNGPRVRSGHGWVRVSGGRSACCFPAGSAIRFSPSLRRRRTNGRLVQTCPGHAHPGRRGPSWVGGGGGGVLGPW